MAHQHGTTEHYDANATRRLRLALGITVFIMVAEVVGGILSGSLALVSCPSGAVCQLIQRKMH